MASDFNATVIHTSMEHNHIEKKCSLADASIKNLNKFNPDDFNVHKDAFFNLLAQTYRAHIELIGCIVCSTDVPMEIVDTVEGCLFQLPLVRPGYDENNRAVFHKLKVFLIDIAGWALIKHVNVMEDGCGAFWALTLVGPLQWMR